MAARQKFFQSSFKVLQGSGLGRMLAPLTQGCGVVFTLHHVRPFVSGPYAPNRHLEITPEFLRESVAGIRRNGYEIIALDEAVDLLKSGYGRKRYAVLSFDDGYRDNYEVAFPVLKELSAPFTIFVASGLIDRQVDLWWVALEQIIGNHDTLVLAKGQEPVSCRTLDEKLACYTRMVQWLTQEVDEHDQRRIIQALTRRYEFDMAGLLDKEMMTWDDLRQLSGEPEVTLGAHTHSHFALARLSDEDARLEIETCIGRMQSELGRKPKHFAYPYGNQRAFSERDARLLKNAGFNSAVTTVPGVLKSSNARAPMMLPRVSLNGQFQDPYVIDQYLTGAPFALYKAARWVAGGFGLKSGVSRLFPSTR